MQIVIDWVRTLSKNKLRVCTNYGKNRFRQKEIDEIGKNSESWKTVVMTIPQTLQKLFEKDIISDYNYSKVFYCCSVNLVYFVIMNEGHQNRTKLKGDKIY